MIQFDDIIILAFVTAVYKEQQDHRQIDRNELQVTSQHACKYTLIECVSIMWKYFHRIIQMKFK